MVFPMVNKPAGISAMPGGMLVFTYKRKNNARPVLVTATAVSGTATLTFTQLDEVRLVVLCKT